MVMFGIFPDTFDADVNIPLDHVQRFSIVKGYNVCESIVLEVFVIEDKKKFIIAKNVIYFSRDLMFRFNTGINPLPDFLFFL